MKLAHILLFAVLIALASAPPAVKQPAPTPAAEEMIVPAVKVDSTLTQPTDTLTVPASRSVIV